MGGRPGQHVARYVKGQHTATQWGEQTGEPTSPGTKVQNVAVCWINDGAKTAQNIALMVFMGHKGIVFLGVRFVDFLVRRQCTMDSARDSNIGS